VFRRGREKIAGAGREGTREGRAKQGFALLLAKTRMHREGNVSKRWVKRKEHV
jgi:hypothetical protein